MGGSPDLRGVAIVVRKMHRGELRYFRLDNPR